MGNKEITLMSKKKKNDLLKKLEYECAMMSDIISGDDFEDLDSEELENIVILGENENKYCYLLDTMYQYISGYISKNKKDKIPDPMDSTYKGGQLKYLSLEIIDSILEKYK